MLISLGNVLSDAGRLDDAEPVYQQVIATAPHAPESAGAYEGLAAIYQDRGDLPKAVQASKKAAELLGDADNAYAVALVLENIGHRDDAMDLFQLAARLRPEFADAHHKLAGYLRQRGLLDEAIGHYQIAIQTKPEMAEFHSNLANALRLARRYDEALASIHQAIRLKPDLAESHNILGAILKDRDQPAEALAAFTRALQLKPDLADAVNNTAVVIEQAGRIDEAGALYERAVSLNPQHGEYHEHLGLNLLLRGQLERGWQEMDWRRTTSRSAANRFLHHPMWDGSDLSGRTILLHAEQGIGDTIQFLRYAPLVRDRGGRVIVECQSPLMNLVRSVDGVSAVVAQRDPLPAFDLQCPLMSLPIPIRTRLDSIPANVPYIKADPTETATWKAILSSATGRKIGLVWAGKSSHRNDKNRSFPPEMFAPLAAVPGITWINLQKDSATSPPEQLKLLDYTHALTDFSETAALIANLDLIITVDTAVAHLAGAMAKPTWILLPAVPDWRWLLARDDSPWYPTARLFRQTTPGDWPSVINRVAAALA